MTIVTMKDVGRLGYDRSCLTGSRKNRIKRILVRLQHRKAIYAAWSKALLSTPVPDYIKRIPSLCATPRTIEVFTLKRYRDEAS